ncbi:hypothetical protein L596_010160 [Steinernema carpocapsae]|uniref:Tectonic domain-containing protein n=1 Tax=Steinernema carpocapsae TaxID=34508 RepID=A0A4U5PI99_STECR|nr:hypothetical protein L596_010160 [Steinernema carpocapsae]
MKRCYSVAFVLLVCTSYVSALAINNLKLPFSIFAGDNVNEVDFSEDVCLFGASVHLFPISNITIQSTDKDGKRGPKFPLSAVLKNRSFLVYSGHVCFPSETTVVQFFYNGVFDGVGVDAIPRRAVVLYFMAKSVVDGPCKNASVPGNVFYSTMETYYIDVQRNCPAVLLYPSGSPESEAETPEMSDFCPTMSFHTHKRPFPVSVNVYVSTVQSGVRPIEHPSLLTLNSDNFKSHKHTNLLRNALMFTTDSDDWIQKIFDVFCGSGIAQRDYSCLLDFPFEAWSEVQRGIVVTDPLGAEQIALTANYVERTAGMQPFVDFEILPYDSECVKLSIGYYFGNETTASQLAPSSPGSFYFTGSNFTGFHVAINRGQTEKCKYADARVNFAVLTIPTVDVSTTLAPSTYPTQPESTTTEASTSIRITSNKGSTSTGSSSTSMTGQGKSTAVNAHPVLVLVFAVLFCIFYHDNN